MQTCAWVYFNEITFDICIVCVNSSVNLTRIKSKKETVIFQKKKKKKDKK